MECSCIRAAESYRIYVEAIDKETLIYQDLSDWMDESDGSNYCLPETYQVTVIPPASKSGSTLDLLAFSTNKITDKEIGKIVDGIYCFSIDICGLKTTLTRAIFPYLECCIKQAWVVHGGDKKQEIEEVETHLKLATINAELSNIKLAQTNLNIAKRLLENIKCDCNC